jgi:lipopolysaccharide export LptBFGC system permease protein LptF
MAEPEQQSQARRDEDDDQRLDRELLELLNEVRVAMPGVQVLFGFLLAVPFQQRFAHTTHAERQVYFGTLMCSAFATAFLVFPVAYHRVMFRRRDKPQIVATGNVALLVGLLFLAVSMTGSVLLVSAILFKTPTVIAAVIPIVVLFGGLWFGYPLVRRIRGDRSW